jgi:hypothetical protein
MLIFSVMERKREKARERERERELANQLRKTPDKDRFCRKAIRTISLGYSNRDYFEGGRRRVGGRYRIGSEGTRRGVAGRPTAGLRVSRSGALIIVYNL